MLDRNILANKIKANLLDRAPTGVGEAEEERTALKRGNPTKCFLCRAGFIYRGSNEDNSGRFCSDRCRDVYDKIGLRYRPPQVRYTRSDGRANTPVNGGFRIRCRHCHVEFNSKGLAFCSQDCRRLDETCNEARAAGYESRQGRMCVDCGALIPRYTPSGRATKVTVARCSSCQRKAVRMAKATA